MTYLAFGLDSMCTFTRVHLPLGTREHPGHVLFFHNFQEQRRMMTFNGSKIQDAIKIYIRWIFTIGILMVLFYYLHDVYQISAKTSGGTIPTPVMQEIVMERNILSKQLNEMRKSVGQLQCEVNLIT